MKQLPFAEFAAQHDPDAQRLIDVREQNEWDDVHVKVAELHPLSKLRNGVLPEQDDREVFIICRSGARSAVAAQMLEARGWPEITNISDGTLGAIDAGEEHLDRG